MDNSSVELTSKEFFSEKKILIIDTSKSFSQMMQKSLAEFGLKPGSVKIASTNAVAQEFLQEMNPQIIISEYKVGEISGFTYADHLKKNWPNKKDRIFILVTANADENSIVDAAEEDVDGFVLKPFSPNFFQEVMSRVVHQKQNPSRYMLAIETVKQMIDAKKFDAAEQLAKAATKLSKSPALAHAYLADIYREQGDFAAAILECDAGLSYNSAHYKCLRGRINVLKEMGDGESAQETLGQFFKIFPPSSELLAGAFDLTVETGVFENIRDYYVEYKKKDQRSAKLVKSACTALFAAAKQCLDGGDLKNAKEYFNWCIVSSGRSVDYIEKIVRLYLELRRNDEAEVFFKMYPSGLVGSPHHSHVDFMISKYTLAPDQVVEKGRQLIAKGAVNVEIYVEVISQMRVLGRQVAAENIAFEAGKKFPDEKEVFSKLLN